jgi:hypothetical protein
MIALCASTVYFLVSELPGQEFHHDSFVLPLDEPAHIAHARDLVRFGPSIGETIVFADIVAGRDDINRDLLKPGKPAYSWHVSEFTAFGDFGIELVDGHPTFVEGDVAGWIDNTDGNGLGMPSDGVGAIGFWNYTVTAELTGPPTDLRPIPAAIPLPAALPVVAIMLIGIAGVRRLRRRSI